MVCLDVLGILGGALALALDSGYVEWPIRVDGTQLAHVATLTSRGWLGSL